MTSLVSRLRGPRIANLEAFGRRWIPVVLSTLPFWSSGHSVYGVLAVGALGAVAALFAGVPILAPAAAAFAIRMSFERRALSLWFCAVFPAYVVVLWCLSGFDAGFPWAWYDLWYTWFSNSPISLWIPVCTSVALLLWLGPTRAGARRIDLSFPRLRYPHFLSFVLVCVVTPGLIGWYWQPLSIASRVGLVLGVVAAMSLVSRLYQSVNQRLRIDTKRLAVNEVQRDEPAVQQLPRVAAVVQAAHLDPVDPFAYANEEAVMPTLPVGIREEPAEAEILPEMIPQKGDLIGPGETLSARSWHVLDAGNEDDEDDNYALMRPSYQRVAGDVEALKEADRARAVVIPIDVEPSPPALPDADDLPPEVLETMLPHAELDDDLSDSEILSVADPIELGVPVTASGAGQPADDSVSASDAAEFTVVPEVRGTPVGESEPMVMEDLVDDRAADSAPAFPVSVPLVAPPDLPVQPSRDRLPFGPEPVDEMEETDVGSVPASDAASTAATQPEFAIDMDITSADIHEQKHEPVAASVIAPTPQVISDPDPAAARRMRSMVSRMISAHTRIVSEGGGAAEIQRLIVPNLTSAHEAMLDQFGGRDLRLALEALRTPEASVPAVDLGETPATAPVTADPEPVSVAIPEPTSATLTPNEPAQVPAAPTSSDRPALVAEAEDSLAPVFADEPAFERVAQPQIPSPAAERPSLPEVRDDLVEGPAQATVAPAPEPEAHAPSFEVDLAAVLGGSPDAVEGGKPDARSSEPDEGGATVSAPAVAREASASDLDGDGVVRALSAAARLQAAASPAVAAGQPATSEPTASADAGLLPVNNEGVKPSEDVMYPVFELDEALIAKASAPEPVAEPVAQPQPEPQQVEGIPAEDAGAIAQVSDWLDVTALSEMDLEQQLLKRGRGLPDDMEIEFLTRKLSEYDGTPKSFHGLEGMLSSLMIRPGADGSYGRQDVAMAKGIFSLISSHIYDRWKFNGRDQMLVRLVFFFNDPFTKRLVSRIDGWLKDGFTAQKDVALARAQLPVIEHFFAAYPDRSSQLRDLNAALDLAEFSFSQPTVGSAELVHEGLHSGFARDVSAATGRARARLQTAALPLAVQDAIAHFMKVASVIDEIDVMIKRESIKHKAPTETHPLYSALMELEYRAVEIINDLRSKLVRRENVLDELPALLRERNKDAAHLFERLQADADAISEAVVDSRERLAAAEHGLMEIERLGAIIAQRDETVSDLRKDLSQRVVMDALVAAANIVAEREPRFSVIERKGLAKLRAVVEQGVEVAVVFVHGLDSKWSVMSGSRLELQGVRGETVQSLDLKAMRETVRNTHAFASATNVRLRVVLESGDLAGGRTDFVFTRQEVVANPSKLLDESDFDSL